MRDNVRFGSNADIRNRLWTRSSLCRSAGQHYLEGLVMKTLIAAIMVVAFSAPAIGDVTYDQRLSEGKFLCTHTSGKELYDTGDIISLDRFKYKIKVTLGVGGHTLTAAFPLLTPTVYDFTKSLLITKKQDQEMRWHLLFNHQPDKGTPFATQSVSFLMRGWVGQKPLFGLVFTEPLTASDRRLFVRTSFYNCEPI